jgi:hypothetical protein
MSEAFVRKNVKLSIEFDEYLAKHPALFKHIPAGAYIVITVKGDEKFNANSVSIIRSKRTKKVVEAHKTDSRWTIKPLRPQTA